MTERAPNPRPWRRLWLAFFACLILPALSYSIVGVLIEHTPMGRGIALLGAAPTTIIQLVSGADTGNLFVLAFGLWLVRYATLCLLLALPWIFIVRRESWARGAPDFWACAIAVAAILAIAWMAHLAPLLIGRDQSDDDRGYDVVVGWLFHGMFWVAIASMPLGALVRAIAGVRKAPVESRSGDIARVPPVTTNGAPPRNLAASIRVRENLEVINALASVALTSLGFTLLMVLVASIILTIADMSDLGQNLRSLPLILVVGATLLALAAPMALLQRIHRRVLAGVGFIVSGSLCIFALWRVQRFYEAPAAMEVSGLRAELAIFLFIAALPALFVYGGMMLGFAGMAVASRQDFIDGRGWRPGVKRLLSNARRVLGMPSYVSALGRAQWGVTALFAISVILFSMWIATPFAIAFPRALPGFSFSALASAEGSIELARANCLPDEEARSAAVRRIFDALANVGRTSDATAPANSPLSACVRIMAQPVSAIFTPTMMAGFAGVFGIFGLAFGRAAQRAATRNYQRVTEWDNRKPIVFLRSFRADEANVPRRLLSFLPALVFRPGQPRTLDEILLEVAAPHGPVIAIGRPEEALPPLGAARIYAKGDEWRDVVTGLCDAAATIVICVDSTEGVLWEYEDIIRRGYASKTVVLVSPQMKPAERAVLSAHLFGHTPLARNVIGATPTPAGAQVLTAPRLSRAAYAVALSTAILALTEAKPAN